MVDGELVDIETLSNPIPNGSFIIHADTGAQIKADRNKLAASLQSPDRYPVHGLWVTVSSKGVRCIADITGERVSKTDWNNKVGEIESAQIVERNGKCITRCWLYSNLYCIGSCVLVVFTDKNKAVVYSLPHLEYLQTLHLPESDM